MINRHCKECHIMCICIYTHIHVYILYLSKVLIEMIHLCTCDQFSDRSPPFLVPIHQTVPAFHVGGCNK